MPNNQPSRELHVLLTVSGNQNSDGTIEHRDNDPNSLQFSYSMSYAVPSGNNNAVASNGDLDLSEVGVSSTYGNEVDIYIQVTGSINGTDGHLYPIRFAQPNETSGNSKQVGFCWRVNNETDENPIPWPNNIVVTRTDNNNILIDDQSPGSSAVPYYYCLGTAFDNVPGYPTPNYYYVTFDPKIVHG